MEWIHHKWRMGAGLSCCPGPNSPQADGQGHQGFLTEACQWQHIRTQCNQSSRCLRNSSRLIRRDQFTKQCIVDGKDSLSLPHTHTHTHTHTHSLSLTLPLSFPPILSPLLVSVCFVSHFISARVLSPKVRKSGLGWRPSPLLRGISSKSIYFWNVWNMWGLNRLGLRRSPAKPYCMKYLTNISKHGNKTP